MSAISASTASSASGTKRKLRSGTVRDSPSPPPKRSDTLGPVNVDTNQTYNLDKVGVPAPLKAKKISRCYVEFLDIGLKDVPNHCFLRMVFQHPQKEASPRAPADTKGLILDFSPVGNMALNPVPGDLDIETFTYDGAHRQAIHVMELPVGSNKKVKDFLRVIEDADLLPVGFGASGSDVVGCRDFVSQQIYHLNQAKVLKLPTDASTSVYDQFNYRYNGDKTSTPDAVGLAVFHDGYKHVDIPGINYPKPSTE